MGRVSFSGNKTITVIIQENLGEGEIFKCPAEGWTSIFGEGLEFHSHHFQIPSVLFTPGFLLGRSKKNDLRNYVFGDGKED